MQTIQPGQLVLSVFGLNQAQARFNKSQTFSIVLSLAGAFLIVLFAALVLSLAVSSFGSIRSFGLKIGQEKAAYLPSQSVSLQLNQGYYNLR